MKNVRYKAGFWVVLTVLVFAFFRWLFEIAIPDIALSFALGITIILISGLASGRAISMAWFGTNGRPQSRIIGLLALVLILSLVAIAFLLNEMVGDTKIHHFLFTIFLLFLASALVAAIATLLRQRTKNELREAHLVASHTDSELKLLQAQLSPHFLFNTLNNLYGLSLSEHKRVPELLLKLSDLLRYTVYETKEASVAVAKELEYIGNYIDFERLRLGDRLELQEERGRLNEGMMIPPMLLIVFVENAFKHARNSPNEKIIIELGVSCEGEEFMFSVKNSFHRSEANSMLSKRNSGFGLDNVRKRLDLVYPERHSLDIKVEESTFSVLLALKNP